jgi:hypothetical protein
MSESGIWHHPPIPGEEGWRRFARLHESVVALSYLDHPQGEEMTRRNSAREALQQRAHELKDGLLVRVAPPSDGWLVLDLIAEARLAVGALRYAAAQRLLQAAIEELDVVSSPVEEEVSGGGDDV